MSPRLPTVGVREISFPRVSGDEPVTLRANVADFKFSPRERG